MTPIRIAIAVLTLGAAPLPAGALHPAPPAAIRAVAADTLPTGSAPAVHLVRVGSRGEGVFAPADLTVRRGDTVRFVAEFGVHNVSFPAASNPGRKRLPAASGYLLREGDTFALAVDLPPGTYRFQCDPHAGMGMVGTLVVRP